MTFTLALIAYLVFLLVYWLFVLTILWHIREYTVPRDSFRWIIWSFLIVIVILNILSLILFFNLPIK